MGIHRPDLRPSHVPRDKRQLWWNPSHAGQLGHPDHRGEASRLTILERPVAAAATGLLFSTFSPQVLAPIDAASKFGSITFCSPVFGVFLTLEITELLL